jgi:hypothetical protein
MMLGLGVGGEACHTSGCDDGARSVGFGPIFQLEVGARPIWFLEVYATGSYSPHPVTYKTGSPDLSASAYAFGTAAGVRLRPLDLSSGSGFFANLDPWIGALIGFHWYNESATDDNAPLYDSDRQLRRVLMKLGLGADYWFDSHMTLGAFFSYDREFAGSFCSATGDNGDVCRTIRANTLSTRDGTLKPSELPQFLSFGLAYRLYL